MTLPNFLIIGSQKAGTTTLYHVIKKHPEIYMPETKEINFFFHEEIYRRGLSYYRSFFQNAPAGKRMLGEASPGYICHPKVPGRIHQDLPNIEKLIVTVRNPVDRAWSQYLDNLRHLEIDHSFEDAYRTELRTDYEPGKLGYFSRGTYIQYIRRYVDLFGRDRLLVLVFDDLKRDPVALYQRIFEFLGVDPGFRSSNMTGTFNASKFWTNPAYKWFFRHPRYNRYLGYYGRRLLCRGRKEIYSETMLPALRRQLISFYEPWNKELASFLECDLSAWNN